jgi:hypothetical protein
MITVAILLAVYLLLLVAIGSFLSNSNDEN